MQWEPAVTLLGFPIAFLGFRRRSGCDLEHDDRSLGELGARGRSLVPDGLRGCRGIVRVGDLGDFVAEDRFGEAGSGLADAESHHRGNGDWRWLHGDLHDHRAGGQDRRAHGGRLSQDDTWHAVVGGDLDHAGDVDR